MNNKIFLNIASYRDPLLQYTINNVKEPVDVRFGFTNTAMPNLFSAEGLPVNLFRTDK